MNREEFNQYWENKGHQASDTDYKAYQLGQQVNENTVRGQQSKIANQIRKAGAGGESDSQTPPVANHHPTQHYMSWSEYSGNRSSMGYAVTKKDYDHYLRSSGITSQGDHDISSQTIHKNGQGSGSISKGEPDHVHDQKQGDSTGKGVPPTGPPPSEPAKAGGGGGVKPPDTQPLPTQRTQPYTYPYKNLPFDPTRQPSEIGDSFYSGKYQDQLTRWSRDNWDRYQRKQPLIPKPLPPKETMARERDFLTSKTKTYDQIAKDTMKNTKFIPAKEVKVSVYTKQKPYYMEIKGVRQAGLYNIKGEKFDETGPKLDNLGWLGESYDGSTDNPEKIREQAWSRGFDLLGVAASWASAAATTSKTAAAVTVRNAAQRQMARNAARVRSLTRGRYGQMSTRVTGTSRAAGARAPAVSRGGLFRRPTGLESGGPASAGRLPTRIGELPMGGGASSALTGGGAEALQNAGL